MCIRDSPRITHASPQDVQRPVLGVVSAPSGLEGEGFPVRRTMAGIRHEHLDPFIMMDHMGEVDSVSYTHLDVYKRQTPEPTPTYKTPQK